MRRVSTSLPLLAFGLAALLGGSTTLRAGVIVTTVSQAGGDTVLPVSNADLFQTNLSSIATEGYFNGFAANAPSLLVDGAFGQNWDGAASVAPQQDTTITFLMDLSVNTSGYTLTRLDTFAGWDTGRDGQEYTVSYSVVSAPTAFLHLVTIPRFDPVGGSYFNTKVGLTDDTGILAAHVAAIRYTFSRFENDGTAYREIDAFGSATASAVPEPSTAALGGLGALFGAMLRLRRRRAGRSV